MKRESSSLPDVPPRVYVMCEGEGVRAAAAWG